MTDIENARAQLLSMAAQPGVAELTAIVSNIALELNFGLEAGAPIRLLEGEGTFVDLREALMELCCTLESLRDRYREYERTVDRMHWYGTAPRSAAELVLRLLRARLLAIDDLIWNLPRPRRQPIEG